MASLSQQKLLVILHCDTFLLFLFIQEELRKQQRKVARKEKKQKTAAVDDGDINPELTAMMGFAGFGTSKK